MNKSHSKVKQT